VIIFVTLRETTRRVNYSIHREVSLRQLRASCDY